MTEDRKVWTPDDLPLDPEVNLRVEADARGADVEHILQENPVTQFYLTTLTTVAQLLLRGSVAEALRRIFKAVPAAQRISAVEWPPHPGIGFRHTVPPQVVDREGVIGGPISQTLARQAVETRNALFFSRDLRGEAAPRSASVHIHRIRSAVYVPLIDSEDRILGLLCVDTPEPSRPFLLSDFQFIRAVGALLTASLAEQRLRDEVRAKESEARWHELRREAMASFMTIASQEMRNPLTVIQLAAHTLRITLDEAEREEAIGEILNACRRSRRLIDTYLELSSVEGGRPLEVKLAPTRPGPIVDGEIRFLQKCVRPRMPIQFVNALDCEELTADEDKLRQIFGNLLANAVKYMPEGGQVRVSSSRGEGELVFRVGHTGQAISEPDRGMLVQEFQRFGAEEAARGNGLALWLTHALVSAHGGRIEVEGADASEESAVTFRIPQP